MENRKIIRPDCRIRVLYEDKNKFGGPSSSKFSRKLKISFQELENYLSQTSAVDWDIIDGICHDGIASLDKEGLLSVSDNGEWQICEEVLFPNKDKCKPKTLLVEIPDENLRGEYGIFPEDWPVVLDLFEALFHDGISIGSRKEDESSELFEEFVRSLDDAGFLCEVDAFAEENNCIPDDADWVFLGHNTVLVKSAEHTILIDPMMFPKSVANPSEFQPMQTRELGKVDAILLTHSHPDHYHLGSLFQFGSDVRIVIPNCERESLLAIDMKYRLSELGFKNVVELNWGEEFSAGSIDIQATPFVGEDPTIAHRIHPGVRNCGNTYLVTTKKCKSLFLADAGEDDRGTIGKELLKYVQERDLDVIFSGYRGWSAYPFQHLLSSVPEYFLFCGRLSWRQRQETMLTAESVINLAELLGARLIVPYADGGAPWHWRIGLGPDLSKGLETKDFFGFDYPPEKLSNEAARRSSFGEGSWVSSDVAVAVVRPNDRLRFGRGKREKVFIGASRNGQNCWPFG